MEIEIDTPLETKHYQKSEVDNLLTLIRAHCMGPNGNDLRGYGGILDAIEEFENK